MSNAFSNALALESVGELGIFNAATGTYSGVTHDDLVSYARTVAYKVFHNLKLGHTMSKEDDPLTVDGVSAANVWADHYEAASEDAILKAMVNRFLAWKLPQDFAPDAGISFNRHYFGMVGHEKTRIYENPDWPTGTNLLHAGQALEMFKHCLPADLIAPPAADQCCGKCEKPDVDGPGEEDGPWAEGWEAGVPGSYGYDCLERFAAVEQPGAKPYTDADGWIEWNGGKCPVPGDTVVQVKLRDNLKGTNHACRYRWTRICNYDDIIAYRVAQEGGAA